jgi:glycosyltransferase involved in cell wall biosynthesis
MPMRESVRGLRRDKVRPGRRFLKAAVGTGVYVARLTRLLRRLRPDIVHTNSLKAAIYGGFAGRLAGVPVVWHVRDRIAPDYLPPSAVRLVRALARRLPHAVIANSRTTLGTLPQSMPDVAMVVADAVPLRAHAAVIPGPIVVNPPRVPRGAARGEHLRVGLVGRLAPWKGQHVFLRAFAAAFPDCGARAVVIGMPLFGELDYEQELHDLAGTLGLRERVEFQGFVEDVATQLERLDILVHASIIPEPFGQVVIEGMAAGLPVVAAGAGGPAEVIEDGVTGILYPPGDVGALASALRKLAAKPHLRERLGRAGRVQAAGFAPDIVAAQVVEVYRSVLAERAR